MDPMTMMALASLASTAGGLFSDWFGSNNELQQLPTQTKNQKKVQNQVLQNALQMGGPGGGANQAMGLWQQYLNPNSEVYKNFEAPYMQQFEQETIPMLAERFAGLGGGLGGGLSSSGFGQALSSAGGNLQKQLAMLKSQIQQQAAQSLTGQYNQMVNQGLGQDQFAYGSQPGGGGAMGGFGTGVSSALPYAMNAWMNNPAQYNQQNYQAQYPLTNYYDQNMRMNPNFM